MDIYTYLEACDEQDDVKEMIMTWLTLGGLKANNDVKAYMKDQVLIVDQPGSKLNGLMFHVGENYYEPIDWNLVSVMDLSGTTVIKGGVSTKVLRCVSTLQFSPADINAVKDSPDYAHFKIFDKYQQTLVSSAALTGIISDDELELVLEPLGVPYVTMDELEYDRETIVKHAIIPVLKAYFRSFPITKPEVIKVGQGAHFSLKCPENCTGAVVWSGNDGSLSFGGGQPGLMTALGFVATEGIYTGIGMGGGGAGRSAVGSWRRGKIRYNKSVPGWRGTQYGRSGALQNAADLLAMRETLKNTFTRERFDKVRKEDGLYIEGYCTGGNSLNVIWTCLSKNWDDIDPGEYEEALMLARAKAVLLFAGVREATRPDGVAPLNTKDLVSSWTQVQKEIIDLWAKSQMNKMYTPMRGANAF